MKPPLLESYFTVYGVNEIEYVILEASIRLASCDCRVNEIGGVTEMHPK